jgi:hypothetical protein
MTRRRATAWAATAALAAASWAFVSCGKPSDETVIRSILKEAVARAEKRDAAGLMALFAPDYRDFEGRDPEGTRRLVADYFNRYHGIVIHLLGTRIGAVEPDGTASAEFELVLSHGAAEVLRKLIRYAGEYYHFRIDLRRDGPDAWRFTSAAWESVDLTGLFPESLEILRKLFPGL